MSRTQFEIYFPCSFSVSLSALPLTFFLYPLSLKPFIFSVSRFPDIFPTHVRAHAWNVFYCEIVINDKRENLSLCPPRSVQIICAHSHCNATTRTEQRVPVKRGPVSCVISARIITNPSRCEIISKVSRTFAAVPVSMVQTNYTRICT